LYVTIKYELLVFLEIWWHNLNLQQYQNYSFIYAYI
jgi:hypothetical protein